MDPATLIPRPDSIPVAWGWFQLLLLPTFYLHILLMNILLGSAFIATVSHFRGQGGSTACTEKISQKLPFLIAFTVNLGIAPFLFVQVLYGHLLYASTLLMAVFWMWIIAFLIGAYTLAYVYKYRYTSLVNTRGLITALITLFLLAIGFLFSNNFSMMEQPPVWVRYFEQSGGTLLNLNDPTLLPRYLHFMVAALAIGGLAIALFYTIRERKGAQDCRVWIELGCKWFSHATLVNLIIGPWYFLSLPKGVIIPTSLHGGAFLLLLVIGIALAILAVIFGLRRRVLPAVHLVLALLALMIVARSLLRSATLAPWFSLSELTVESSYGPMLLFLLFFAAGLLLIWWMLKLASQATADPEVRS